MITIKASSTSLIAQNNLANTQEALNGHLLQLSTGKRINSAAADDAAGLQITNRMETRISGPDQAQRNANDATLWRRLQKVPYRKFADATKALTDEGINAEINAAGGLAFVTEDVTADAIRCNCS